MASLTPLMGSFGVHEGNVSVRPNPVPTQQPKPMNVMPRKPATPAPTTPAPAAPAAPVATAAYGKDAPPAGFTAQQWNKLLNMSKTNTSIADLIKQYTDKLSSTGTGGTTATDEAWRRTMPTNTTQLMKQLSYNAGEMGMPGGYIGAVQQPAYGSTQAPVNNPDMTKYGQAPGIGEATFYRQSMNGGMAPIAAMSPLGVPAGWNPGGTSSTATDSASKLKDYLTNINGKSGGAGGGNASLKGRLRDEFDRQTKAGAGVGSLQYNLPAMFGVVDKYTAKNPGSFGGKKKTTTTAPKPTSPASPAPATGTAPAPSGTPISLPYGF